MFISIVCVFVLICWGRAVVYERSKHMNKYIENEFLCFFFPHEPAITPNIEIGYIE